MHAQENFVVDQAFSRTPAFYHIHLWNRAEGNREGPGVNLTG